MLFNSYFKESDFNLAESSIHKLSNSFTLTRGEKIMHSPHTSPKMLRKPLAPTSQEKEASTSSTKTVISNGKPSKPPPPIISSSSSSASSSSSSSVSSISKAPLIDLTSNEGSIGVNAEIQNGKVNSIFARSTSASESPPRVRNVSKDQDAPPIPPRKSMIVDSNRPMKPQAALPITQEIRPVSEINESFSISEENSNLTEKTQEAYDDEDEDEDPICGPAETITGTNYVFSTEF